MNSSVLSERAFILAGGLGTRLRSVVADQPKILAPVYGQFFLDILFKQLYLKGFRNFVFLLGYMAEAVEAHLQILQKKFKDIEINVSVEQQAMGTAGAVKHAQHLCEKTFFLLNGDTFFDFNPIELLTAHKSSKALVTIASCTVPNVARYGSIESDTNGIISSFKEKLTVEGQGLINAGVYVIEPRVLQNIKENQYFSMEQDIFPMLIKNRAGITTLTQKGVFFDIGTPEDYLKFSKFLKIHQEFFLNN